MHWLLLLLLSIGLLGCETNCECSFNSKNILGMSHAKIQKKLGLPHEIDWAPANNIYGSSPSELWIYYILTEPKKSDSFRETYIQFVDGKVVGTSYYWNYKIADRDSSQTINYILKHRRRVSHPFYATFFREKKTEQGAAANP
jgi:hypothetical protein